VSVGPKPTFVPPRSGDPANSDSVLDGLTNLGQERASLHVAQEQVREEMPMTARTKPPFRADHVGSLLRPAPLKDAREKAARGDSSRRTPCGGD
jgi:hypothetical protein